MNHEEKGGEGKGKGKGLYLSTFVFSSLLFSCLVLSCIPFYSGRRRGESRRGEEVGERRRVMDE